MRHLLSNIHLAKCVRVAIFVSVFSLSLTSASYAATLRALPGAVNVTVGNLVTVQILVATGGTAINNVEGTLQFPTEFLEALSLSKGSSIFSLWVEEPKFSNLSGTVSFNGGAPNPGYSGESGQVVSVTFKAKKTGIASVVFSDAAVRANDGLGTDVLTSKTPGTIQISPTGEVEYASPSIPVGAPPAPVVTSTSHPQSNKWYSTSDVELQWIVPAGVTSVSVLMDKKPSTVPTAVYDASTNNKRFSALEDGVWYFHAQLKNGKGWGAVTHFKVQIDTEAPKPFKIVFPAGDAAQVNGVPVSFGTTDSLSGIDHYEVKAGEEAYIRLSSEAVSAGPYTVLFQKAGTHNLLVKAVDMANNETVQTSQFTIASTDMPQIKEYSSELSEKDFLKVAGISPSSTQVEIVVTDAFNRMTSQNTTSLPNGEFSTTWATTLEKGAYTLSARSIDGRGVKSEFTQPLNFTVSGSWLSYVSSLVLSWLSVVIIGILVLGAVALMVIHLVHRNRRLRKSVGQKMKKAESAIHKAFDLLHHNAREQIRMLEDISMGRPLTPEEKKLHKHLEKDLARAEKYLSEEISDY